MAKYLQIDPDNAVVITESSAEEATVITCMSLVELGLDPLTAAVMLKLAVPEAPGDVLNFLAFGTIPSPLDTAPVLS